MHSPERDEIEALRSRVPGLDWWHQIDLGDGLVTPGRDDSAAKLARLALPSSLEGRRVLDIGAWDGFFSFEAERRGAQVVAIDYHAWQRGPGSGRECFEVARRILGSKVEDLALDVMDLAPGRIGHFDVVLCLGVLYHLRDPLGALARIASVTSEQLILETHVDAGGSSRPTMVFYPGQELNGDETNWWGPNETALVAMLRDCGFRRIRVVDRRSRLQRFARALLLWWNAPHVPLLHTLAQDRVVIHAFR